VAGLLVSRSRVGIGAAVLGTLLAWSLAAAPPVARRVRIATAAVTLLLVATVGLAAGGVLRLPGGDETLRVRVGLNRASLDLVAERPLGGHGLGSYPAESLRRRDLEEAQASRGRAPYQGHDDYLHVAVEGGVPAGLLLLAFVVGAFALGAKGRRAALAGRPEAARLLSAALGAFATLAVAALGESVFLDPAPSLLAALCVATFVAALPARAPAGPTAATGVVALAFGLVLLVGAAVLGRDAAADASLRRYRETVGRGVAPEEAEDAARRLLEEGVLAWRPDHPEGRFRLGVHRAEFQRYERAREAYREALAADPSMTEARLDVAKTYEIEGRVDDARATLVEARRLDPTRYDVAMRLGHLALGPEPVPGAAPVAFDPVAALREYNEAARLSPTRFEHLVAQARVERRLGRLAEAGTWLRRAHARAPRSAEVYVESFRLAEAEAQVPDVQYGTILAEALALDRGFAGDVRREVERFLDAGEARERSAREAAVRDPRATDFSSAERAFDAARVRMEAMLFAEARDPADLLLLARDEADAGRHRRALARYRALLTWTLPGAAAGSAPERLLALTRRADLLLEAANAASRVDGARARSFFAQGHLLKGVELLEKGDLEGAETVLRIAAKDDPDSAHAHFALARVLARRGKTDAAREALREALRLSPDLADSARRQPDLAPLLPR
jgi:tetratricopeptide (TPR) repeat protein